MGETDILRGDTDIGMTKGATRASPTKLGEVAERSEVGGGVAQRAPDFKNGTLAHLKHLSFIL
ncbi:hypothetical protein GCM10007874_24290 [Labrys miyagiensis]|uniref:Uncharacterized protein n=1 Tax=Labrys miyagiensis TaxID=346912 RepID=A0ABQ6CGD5_9HYPH|nr:hypothetical protein GCM10007874_24290 [Labrys miyagiensis]